MKMWIYSEPRTFMFAEIVPSAPAYIEEERRGCNPSHEDGSYKRWWSQRVVQH